MPFLETLGAGLGVLSGISGLFGSKKPKPPPTTTLSPFNFYGPGGTGGGYAPGRGPGQGTLQLNYGDLDPFRSGLLGLAQGSGDFAANAGIPPEVLAAAGRVEGAAGIPASLQAMFGGAAGMGMGGLGRAFSDLMGRSGAGNFDSVYGDTLSRLRTQAQPFEDRAFQQLQQNLFGTGRMGTTGGGLQTEAFARGLGQADLDRQLQAGGEARTQMGLDDTLLGNAFSRFSDTSRLFGDQITQGFGFNQAGFDRSQQLLGNASALSEMPMAFRGTALSQMLQALQGQAGLQSQLMQPMEFGLNAEQAASNARLGSASNMVAYQNSPAYTMGQLGPANAMSQLSQVLMGPGNNAADIFRNLFTPLQAPQGASEELIKLTRPSR